MTATMYEPSCPLPQYSVVGVRCPDCRRWLPTAQRYRAHWRRHHLPDEQRRARAVGVATLTELPRPARRYGVERNGCSVVSMPAVNAVASDAPFSPPPGQTPRGGNVFYALQLPSKAFVPSSRWHPTSRPGLSSVCWSIREAHWYTDHGVAADRAGQLGAKIITIRLEGP